MNLIEDLPLFPRRIYAIGDIHGCPQELAVLLNHLKSIECISPADLIIFLGDYIDRGQNPKQVIEILLKIQLEFPNTIFLKGNHEDMLLNFLGFPGMAGKFYLQNGGITTLSSYGLAHTYIASEVLENFPKDHLQFIQTLRYGVSIGDYLFVHAGVNPSRHIDNQRGEDLMWIRDEFMINSHNVGKTVVFGHTPLHEVVCDEPQRIGLDTGLVFGNKLSCMEIFSKKLFQVKRGGESVLVGIAEQLPS